MKSPLFFSSPPKGTTSNGLRNGSSRVPISPGNGRATATATAVAPPGNSRITGKSAGLSVVIGEDNNSLAAAAGHTEDGGATYDISSSPLPPLTASQTSSSPGTAEVSAGTAEDTEVGIAVTPASAATEYDGDDSEVEHHFLYHYDRPDDLLFSNHSMSYDEESYYDELEYQHRSPVSATRTLKQAESPRAAIAAERHRRRGDVPAPTVRSASFRTSAARGSGISNNYNYSNNYSNSNNFYSDSSTHFLMQSTATMHALAQATIVGCSTGLCVAVFKRSIEALQVLCYQNFLPDPAVDDSSWNVDYSDLKQVAFVASLPAMGGAMVGCFLFFGGGVFPPGLVGTVKDVDESSKRHYPNNNDALSDPQRQQQLVREQSSFFRKCLAAVVTLGSGCSLGPEGPCVEIGMSVARLCMATMNPRQPPLPAAVGIAHQQQYQHHYRSGIVRWNRRLLACGAAAGVAAGFNAPIAGVFFVLEVMQNAFSVIHKEDDDDEVMVPGINSRGNNPSNAVVATTTNTTNTNPNTTTPMPMGSENVDGMFSTAAGMTPVLLASVLSALVCRSFLGDHLVLTLTNYSLKTPLVELPLYLILGAMSGFVAFSFGRVAHGSQAFFAGELGSCCVRSVMRLLPAPVKPVVGGLLNGVVGLFFPQVLFFGYETLNSLLANTTMPTILLLTLLVIKTFMTAISVGSGLVGGTFAPSLFLGAVTGASFHNIMSGLLRILSLGTLSLELADVPAYAMVGAASVLAALFRAPLTASLLLFELTRDYDVILPLMVSAGVGSVICDLLDACWKRGERRKQRRQQRWQHQQQLQQQQRRGRHPVQQQQHSAAPHNPQPTHGPTAPNTTLKTGVPRVDQRETRALLPPGSAPAVVAILNEEDHEDAAMLGNGMHSHR